MTDAWEWNRRIEEERKQREADEAREQARRDAASPGRSRPLYSHPAYQDERNRLELNGQDRAPSGWAWLFGGKKSDY
jgi:hypothetical protein